MCDGSWYLGTLTTTLREAELEYAKALKAAGKIKNKAAKAALVESATKLVEAQRARRTKYRLTPRGRHDPDGARQYVYPVLSEEERYDIDPDSGEVIEIVIPGKTVKIPGKIGKNTADDAHLKHLKYGQEYEFKSEKWTRLYGLRNTIESGNASVKNPDHTALGIAMKRLVRGPWFAALCAAMAAACENIRRIINWYQERLQLQHRNAKNRSHPAIYRERDSAKYRSERRATTAPPDRPLAA